MKLTKKQQRLFQYALSFLVANLDGDTIQEVRDILCEEGEDQAIEDKLIELIDSL